LHSAVDSFFDFSIESAQLIMSVLRSVIACTLLFFIACVVAAAHPGVGVVVDRHGNVFYTDLKQVWRIDPSGNKSVAVPNVHTHELWLDSHDALYGEHLWYSGPQDGSGKWYHRVWKRTSEGHVIHVIPATEGFRTTFSFVRDAAGNGYMAGIITDSAPKIVRFIDGSGNSGMLAGGAAGRVDGQGAAAGFTNIRWMCIGQDGNLYLVDEGDVRRVTPAGVVTTLARGVAEHNRLSLTERRHDLMGLYADAFGDVYVTVYGARMIKKIGRDGKVTVFDRSTLPWSPTGITIAGHTAYILEYADPLARVRKIGLR